MNRGLDLVGRQVGAYRINSLIGAGGCSRVYLGVDENVGRQAAIKVLLPAHGEEGYSETVIQRFEREARIVANLRDPHSVQLYEYGQTDDGMLYMIFEFIEGDTLEEVRRRDGALSVLRVVKILEQVLLSLEEAHTMGLVHRDIKPANIMLFEHIGRKDQVKVLDFGVGKAVGPDSTRQDITEAGMLIGTPRYMAPEQWSSDGDISQQTDIYSLGLVIYELLTGERAITASEPVHIMKAHIDPTPITLPERLDIPSGFRRVVNTMLQKDPEERYASASDVLADVSRLKPVDTRSDTLETDEDELARRAGPPTAEVASREVEAGVDTGPVEGASGRSRRSAAPLAVVVAAFLVGLLTIIYVFGSDAPTDGHALQDTQSPPASSTLATPSEPVSPPQVEAGKDSKSVPDGSESADGSTEVAPLEKSEVSNGEVKDSEVVEQSEKAEQEVAENAPEEVDEQTEDPVASKNKKVERSPKQRPSKLRSSARRTEKNEQEAQEEKSGTGNQLILYPADEE